jgi:hypothetical protein
VGGFVLYLFIFSYLLFNYYFLTWYLAHLKHCPNSPPKAAAQWVASSELPPLPPVLTPSFSSSTLLKLIVSGGAVEEDEALSLPPNQLNHDEDVDEEDVFFEFSEEVKKFGPK